MTDDRRSPAAKTAEPPDATAGRPGPFWQSRKLWYTAMALVAFMALALTGSVQFSSEQVMVIIMGVLGLSVGGHAATDIAAMVTRRGADRRGGEPIDW